MTKRLTLTPVVDPSKAIQGFGKIQSGAAGVSGAVAGIGKKGTSFGALASAMNASGLPGQFGQLQSLISDVSQGLDAMGEKGKISFGKVAMGAGIIGAGLGGVGEMLSSPLEAARAQLDQSLKNAGENADKFSGPIGKVQNKMQGLGFTYADTDSALAKLTQGLGSGTKAIAESGLTADLAARNHIDLSSAADLVVKSYAKSPMALRQFGINLTDITAKGKTAAAAQKAHTKAQDALTKAQERLGQVQEHIAAGGNAKGEASTRSLVSAQTALATAGQHLQEVQARIQAGTLTGASAQSELETAQNRVAAATARVDQAQQGASASGLTVSQQIELANAQQAVATAQQNVATTGAAAAATAGDLNNSSLTGQQILDMLAKKTHGLAQVQANTFGGDLRKWKATVIDFGATWGEKFAKPLIAIGPALAGVGALVETGFFGAIGRGISTAVTGIGGLASKLLGLKSTASGVGSAVGAKGGSLGAASTDGPQLTTAAEALQMAAEALQGAASSLGAGASGLEASSAAMDTSASSLGAAGTALDGSATGLDSAAAALDSAAGTEGAVGSLGEGALLGGSGLSSAALPLAAVGGAAFGGAWLQNKALRNNESVFDWLTGGKPTVDINGKPVTFVSPQQANAAVAATPTGGYGATGIPGKPGYKPPAFEPVPHAASGAIVAPRPGGTIIDVAEGGEAEVISPLSKLPALVAGAGGPQVQHLHMPNVIVQNPTIQAHDYHDFVAQMQAKARRANFSGTGWPDGSEL